MSFFHIFTSNKQRSILYDCPVKVYVYYSLTWPILFSPICRLIAVTKLITNQESSLISCVFPQVYLFSRDFEFTFQICQTNKTSSVEIFLVLGFTVEQNVPSASKKNMISIFIKTDKLMKISGHHFESGLAILRLCYRVSVRKRIH